MRASPVARSPSADSDAGTSSTDVADSSRPPRDGLAGRRPPSDAGAPPPRHGRRRRDDGSDASSYDDDDASEEENFHFARKLHYASLALTARARAARRVSWNDDMAEQVERGARRRPEDAGDDGAETAAALVADLVDAARRCAAGVVLDGAAAELEGFLEASALGRAALEDGARRREPSPPRVADDDDGSEASRRPSLATAREPPDADDWDDDDGPGFALVPVTAEEFARLPRAAAATERRRRVRPAPRRDRPRLFPRRRAAASLAADDAPPGCASALGSFPLRVVFDQLKTGFELGKDLAAQPGSSLAGRYEVEALVGRAAFSSAYAAVDHAPGLLKENLYEYGKLCRDRDERYFTRGRVRTIAGQCLAALAYCASLGIIHCDIKPENIVLEDYEAGSVKIIDFGSSCFASDRLATYVQSRSYRAPEVVLGLDYDAGVDVWSLGCVLAEVWGGYVLLQNDSVATMLARLQGILGPIPRAMVERAPNRAAFFTRSGHVYERFDSGRRDAARDDDSASSAERPEEALVVVFPQHTTLARRLHLPPDDAFVDFVQELLAIDPDARPSATTAKLHPSSSARDRLARSLCLDTPKTKDEGGCACRDE
ncbi:protein kinase [Aureococcus anophagefferens]|nr:protein kinase [Aureococcus anophagefferens]